MGALWFVTGGARSGKSRFAERLAASAGVPVVYLATMQARDDELRDRVARHRADRPAAWLTVEAPLHPAPVLADAADDACVLLDCLSLWVSNRLLEYGELPEATIAARLEVALDEELDALLEAVRARTGPTILVTNEVGSGIVPDNVLGRVFRDVLGRVNQRACAAADRAWLLVAGRALELPAPD